MNFISSARLGCGGEYRIFLPVLFARWWRAGLARWPNNSAEIAKPLQQNNESGMGRPRIYHAVPRVIFSMMGRKKRRGLDQDKIKNSLQCYPDTCSSHPLFFHNRSPNREKTKFLGWFFLLLYHVFASLFFSLESTIKQTIVKIFFESNEYSNSVEMVISTRVSS